MPDKTPGELAYAAFYDAYYADARYMYALSAWGLVTDRQRRAWEAAAQAVLTQAGLLVLDLDPEETRDA